MRSYGESALDTCLAGSSLTAIFVAIGRAHLGQAAARSLTSVEQSGHRMSPPQISARGRRPRVGDSYPSAATSRSNERLSRPEGRGSGDDQVAIHHRVEERDGKPVRRAAVDELSRRALEDLDLETHAGELDGRGRSADRSTDDRDRAPHTFRCSTGSQARTRRTEDRRRPRHRKRLSPLYRASPSCSTSDCSILNLRLLQSRARLPTGRGRWLRSSSPRRGAAPWYARLSSQCRGTT